MAAWAVTQTGRFRAAVMGAGITDWAMQVGVGELGRTDAGLTGSFGWEGPGPPPRSAQPDLLRGQSHQPRADPAR